MRSQFQGLYNIVRFNYHFYVVAFLLVVALFGLRLAFTSSLISGLLLIAILVVIVVNIVSLLVSHVIYDRSGIYNFSWLEDLYLPKHAQVLNIHAGFDESSLILKKKLPSADFEIFDFYDKDLHTELSIKRARKAYPPVQGTKSVKTSDLPIKSDSVDLVTLIFAAHEIRSEIERASFFNEINRILNREGQVVVIEHLRDWHNFLAFSIGFLHFYSRATWMNVFAKSNFRVVQSLQHTPFVNIFILKKQ